MTAKQAFVMWHELLNMGPYEKCRNNLILRCDTPAQLGHNLLSQGNGPLHGKKKKKSKLSPLEKQGPSDYNSVSGFVKLPLFAQFVIFIRLVPVHNNNVLFQSQDWH